MKLPDLRGRAGIALACLVLTHRLFAQSPVAFEAVSIHRNVSGTMNMRINVSGGRLTMTNATVKTLLRNGWHLLSFQFAGGPAWLDTDMYDIVATTGSSGRISDEQLPLLYRSLLADRFALKVHMETHEAPVYALLPAKGGVRIKPAVEEGLPGINTQKGPGGARMKGTHGPIAVLASNLGNQLGRMVIDKTGLDGAYDWLLEWDPDPTAESTKPSLFTAMQEQLGLRLEAQKGPVEVLVIDSIEKASAN